MKVSKGAKIRNRYNQVPHLTLAYVLVGYVGYNRGINIKDKKP